MSPQLIGWLSFPALIALLLLGVPIALGMALVGFLSFWMIVSQGSALSMVGLTSYSAIAVYNFSVMPMFVLLGNFAFRSGFGEEIFRTMRQWFGRLPGGLAVATIFGCAGFGAASGSSIAASATIGRIAVPEMEKYGYDRKLAAGAVASGGPLASMIPPSNLMVLFGMITGTSIGRLLIAGFIPGIVSAILLSVSVLIRAWRNPSLGQGLKGITWNERIRSLRQVWGLLIIATAIMASIYTGIATPTEAGAFGAFVALLIGISTRKLSFKNALLALTDSVRTVSMLFFIVAGAFIFVYQFTVTRLPYMAADYIAALDIAPLGVLVVIMLLYIILGCFFDPAPTLFLTLPVIFPIIQSLGMDPVWFGILIVQNCEIGAVTPPMGITLFATRSVIPNMKTSEIVQGIVPFLIPMLTSLILLILFPQIALFLPTMMMGK